MTFRLRHLLAALVLHGLLIALLAGGLQCSRAPTRPPVIRAVLLDPDRKEASAQQKKRADEQRRKAEQERKKLQADQQRKLAEEQNKREADAQRQQAVAEQQRKKAEDAKKQKELAEKKKAEEQARRKQEQEERLERQAAEQRELQDKARMEEALRQEEIAREAQREADARAASEREQKQAVWADALSRHVVKYWNRPGAASDFSCEVRVQLLPDGTVTSAQVVRSCGNAGLDQSVEDAVLRASPMPRPADASVFDRNLTFTFRPR